MRKSAFLIQCLVRFWSHTYDVAENSVVQPFFLCLRARVVFGHVRRVKTLQIMVPRKIEQNTEYQSFAMVWLCSWKTNTF